MILSSFCGSLQLFADIVQRLRVQTFQLGFAYVFGSHMQIAPV